MMESESSLNGKNTVFEIWGKQKREALHESISFSFLIFICRLL